MVSFVTRTPSVMLRRWIVSLTYDGRESTNGLRCSSTILERFSVMDPLPDTMGLPGGSILFLCILGREYNVGIIGKGVRINFHNWLEIMLLLSALSTKI